MTWTIVCGRPHLRAPDQPLRTMTKRVIHFEHVTERLVLEGVSNLSAEPDEPTASPTVMPAELDYLYV